MFGFGKKKTVSVKKYSLDELEIISYLSSKILSTLDNEALIQESINNLVAKYKLLGGIILLREGNYLVAKTISSSPIANNFLKIIGAPIDALKLPIAKDSDNYIVKSINIKKVVQGSNLADFTRGVISENLAIAAKRVTRSNYCISIPIVNKKEALGAIYLTKTVNENFNRDIPIFQLFADQVGIALVNAQLYENEQKQVEELKSKNIELQALRRREQDMMDIMGHELRTPLSIIRISLGLLQEKYSKVGFKDTSCDAYMGRMKEALDREARLLEAMLNSTKLESEKMELHFEKVNMDNLVKDAMLAMSNKAQKKNIQLIYNPHISSPFVYADPVRLAEVVDNLVLNAIKYTEKGAVTISVTKEDDTIITSISDTGIGIPKADIKHLGEKFYRVGQYSDNQKDRVKRKKLEDTQITLVKPGGTGLGLYVSFNLIKLMGGKISVSSSLGKGSTFSISLPVYANQPDTHSKKKVDKNLFKRLGFTRKKS
ncbi:MAG TPA: GAF domain-containing sensor histidine kinase [Candidatus Dojkabacteria bacterium]|nr:GAF domain-containing sensor histidine kinase [Candidatus Dojkabacteria bacterium]